MSVLTKITREAKRIRNAHPRKYDRLANPWSGGYVKEAARNVKRGKTTKPAKKKAKPKPAKKQARKRKSSRAVGSVHQVVGGKVVSRRRRTKRKTRKVGGTRRRAVSGMGNTGLLLGLGVLALGAVYIMTKDSTPAPQYQSLPPIQQTGNYNRDQQSTSVVQWAMAAGLAISAITSLIDRLNKSNDQQVSTIYDSIASGGDATAWI